MTHLPDLLAWIHPALVVKRSSIEGSGLFTTEELPPDYAVIRFGGFLLSASARFDDSEVQRGSVVGVAETVLLAEPPESSKDRSDLINHSCAPNLGLLDALTVVTTQSVLAGEELTCDYAYWEVDQDYIMKQACRCLSADCRSIVTGVDWRDPQSCVTVYRNGLRRSSGGASFPASRNSPPHYI